MPAAQQGIFVLDGAPYPEDRARLAGMQAAGLYAGQREDKATPSPAGKEGIFYKKISKNLDR